MVRGSEDGVVSVMARMAESPVVGGAEEVVFRVAKGREEGGGRRLEPSERDLGDWEHQL